MQSKATTVEKYIDEIPEERKQQFLKLRKTIVGNLPKGFVEVMNYGMVGYVVPHTIYPKGYHVNPADPLPFVSIAVQKNFIALYHMGIYSNEEVLTWFKNEYPKYSKRKLDMGKSCIRFKNQQDIPFDLIGQLIKIISIDDYIDSYEQNIARINR